MKTPKVPSGVPRTGPAANAAGDPTAVCACGHNWNQHYSLLHGELRDCAGTVGFDNTVKRCPCPKFCPSVEVQS